MNSLLMTSAILMSTISVNMEAEPWRAINDGVMGGVSSGGMVQEGQTLRFTGELSLENNGGFASVRRLVEDDLSFATAVRLEVRGDGRTYQFRIRLDDRYDGVAWRHEFATSGEWQTMELPLDGFVPVFRGFPVPNAGPVAPDRIGQIGFMLADKQPGAFALEIAAVEFLGGPDAGNP